MASERWKRGSTEMCPKCGCRKVFVAPRATFKGYGPGLAVCKNCSAIWEPFDLDQIWDRDDPVCSFKEPCNNCAFRPGSEEQKDPEKWIELMDQLRKGGMFFCHKGVPLEPDSEHGFGYSKDTTKLRFCRGYLNASRGLDKRADESRRTAHGGHNDGSGGSPTTDNPRLPSGVSETKEET